MLKYLNIEEMNRFHSKKGIASLPAMLLLGAIVIEIGIAGAFLIFYVNSNVTGTRTSNEALIAAQTGIDDALLLISANKSYSNQGGYTMTIGDTTVEVTVCKDTCVLGKTQIISVGRSLLKRHKIIAIVSVDSTTGLITKDSVSESEL